MYISLSFFVYSCFSLHCDACLKSSVLRVGVKTLHNILTTQIKMECCAESHFANSHLVIGLTVSCYYFKNPFTDKDVVFSFPVKIFEKQQHL